MTLEDLKNKFDEAMRNTTDKELVEEFRKMGCDVYIKAMKLKEEKDIPSYWKRLTVRKKTTVRIRPCNGVERFKVSWADHDLISDPETDIIVIASDGREYPHKKDIFNEVYEYCDHNEWEPSKSTYIKKGTNTIVEIPEGTTPFEVETLEGIVGDVGYPNYVVIGAKGELYVNTREFVETQLEILN